MPQHLRNRLSNTRLLRVFMTVYELGSITRAAEELNLTQPTVSIQLRQLTETVGMPLYQVVGKKMIFTEAAKLVAEYSHELLSTLDRLEIDLADLNQLKAGTLKVAVVTSAKYFIPHLLGSFCRMYPLVDVDLKVGNRDKIRARYQQGLDDIYLFSHLEKEMENSALQYLPNNLYPIANKYHPLAKKKKISIEELLNYPWLAREVGSGTRYAIDAHFSRFNLSLKPKLVVESNEAIKHCVLAGIGLSILSEYALHYEPSNDIVYLPVTGFPIKTSWYIVRSSLKLQTPLSEAFLHHITHQKQGIGDLFKRY